MTGPAVPVVPVVPGTVLALKEWAAAVHALLDGRQTLLLRKGGIHEKRFSVRGSRFVVFPTVAHSHAESTRGEHADLLALGRADVADGSVMVRAELSVAATIAVRRPDRIAELEPFHIWTTESVRRNRIDFRPRHELTAIVVSARAGRASDRAAAARVRRVPQLGRPRRGDRVGHRGRAGARRWVPA